MQLEYQSVEVRCDSELATPLCVCVYVSVHVCMYVSVYVYVGFSV